MSEHNDPAPTSPGGERPAPTTPSPAGSGQTAPTPPHGDKLGEGLNLGGAPTAAPTLDPIADPVAAPAVRQADPPKHGWWWGTGRRKTAVARVRIKPGAGDVKIQVGSNTFKTVEEYFTEERDRADVYAPLKATGVHGKMDVVARLDGGGYMGQAGATLLGIARALLSYDPNTLETLREHGYLTRDPREVERKKYGLAGARRSYQFSKR